MESGWLTSSGWRERARSLEEEGWLLMDLCGVDRFGIGGVARFEVVVQLLRHDTKQRRTLHILVEDDPPRVPSIVDLWPTADFMEKEAYDMFGITFDGHPNLSRILMPDEWEGHPLRKDYGVGKRAIKFAPQPFLQIDTPGQAPDAEEADREVDWLGQPGAPARDVVNAPGQGIPARDSSASGDGRA